MGNPIALIFILFVIIVSFAALIKFFGIAEDLKDIKKMLKEILKERSK